MPSDPGVILSANLLGRDTDATVRHFPAIVQTAGIVPKVFQGTLPRKSPDNHRFVNRRYAGQLIGDCTGEAVAHATEILLRMPADRSTDPAAAPLPPKSLSALYAYWNGRAYARQQGVRMGGEGCVGSFVVFAAKTAGVCSLENYPPTDANYNGYSDRTPPPAAATAEGPQHKILECAIIPTWQAMLEMLAAGFAFPIGISIPSGFTRTDDSGRFTMSGRTVGGHEIVALDYDQDLDRFYILNSWANARWGAKENHPEQDPKCQGFNNIGYCTMSEMERVFSPRQMESGASEAVAINTVEGWQPKLHSFSEAYS